MTTTEDAGAALDWPAGLPHHGARAHRRYADERVCPEYHCELCGGCIPQSEPCVVLPDYTTACAACVRRNRAAVEGAGC